jgi:hypothetical protein
MNTNIHTQAHTIPCSRETTSKAYHEKKRAGRRVE